MLPERKPDFERIKTTLAFQEPDRVPNFEICVARPVREALLNMPLPDGLEAELFYRPRLHYDYIFLNPPYRRPPVYSRHAENRTEARTWVDQHANMVTDWDSFRNYTEYPEPEAPLDLREIEAGCRAARRAEGFLGVGALLPSCPFTEINLVMGYENFAIALYEDYELCKALAAKFGEVGVASAKQLAASDVDFVFFGDDMANTRGLMISPEFMRDLFFPYYRRFIEIVRDAGKPILFHSDGDISALIPDWIDAGLNGLNPIEPLAMDIVALKREYAGKLVLTGNVDVDLLTRGTPEAVSALTRERLNQLKPGGGYMLGSSNSVCDYVNPVNFQTMLLTNAEYGVYVK